MLGNKVSDTGNSFRNELISLLRGVLYTSSEKILFAVSKRLHKPKEPGLVSIPIATYDRIGTLVERTLPSLLAQTHANLEVIIVFDGTPSERLRGFPKNLDSRIRTVFLKRRTRYPKDPKSLWMVAGYRPRNIGAKLARGEYLLWMSDDDELAPNAIESLVQYLQQNPRVDAVGGVYERPGRNPEPDSSHDIIREAGYNYGAMPGWLWRSYLRVFKWNGQSFRKTWDRPSDFDLARRMIRAGVRFGAIDQLVAIQHPSPGTALFGSEAAIHEELERRAKS